MIASNVFVVDKAGSQVISETPPSELTLIQFSMGKSMSQEINHILIARFFPIIVSKLAVFPRPLTYAPT